MKPLKISAAATVEFFVFQGDGINEVKVKLSQDIPQSLDPEIKDHMANVQFGAFYSFLNDEHGLAEMGRIFRAGMTFAQKNMLLPPPPPNDRGPSKDPDPTPLPQDDEELDKYVEDLLKRP